VEPLGGQNFLQLAYSYRQNNSESNRDTRSKDADGAYTVLDSLYSKRLENEFVNQSIELNFRADRGIFDYMLGISAQPSSSRSKTFIGEKTFTISRKMYGILPRWHNSITVGVARKTCGSATMAIPINLR